MVHADFIKLINKLFRNPWCKSIIEVIDSNVEDKRSIIKTICSPIAKQITNFDNKTEEKTFLSSSNTMIISLKRPSPPLTTSEAEFLTGAYFFHDG